MVWRGDRNVSRSRSVETPGVFLRLYSTSSAVWLKSVMNWAARSTITSSLRNSTGGQSLESTSQSEVLNYRPQRCQSHTSRWEEPGTGGCIGVSWCGRRRRAVIGVWWRHRAVGAPQLLGGHQRLLLLILFILLILFLSPFPLFGFRAAAGGALCGLSSLLRRKVPVQEAHDQLKEKPQHTHEQLPGRKRRFTWRRKMWRN